MKIMVISDSHYDKKFYRGVDQSKAWELAIKHRRLPQT